MSQAPIMPVFTDAVIADTTFLSAEEFGAYCLILFATWRNNGQPFPDDDRKLARICRVPERRWRDKIRPLIVGFFDLSEGNWRQKRLEKEWEYIAARSAERAASGRSGATRRWAGSPQNDGNRNRKMREATARTQGTHSEEEWHLMLTVFGNRCLVCGGDHGITKDHVRSLYDGGEDSIGNLQPLCFDCNSKKGTLSEDYRDPKLLKRLHSQIAELSVSHSKPNGKTIASHTHTHSHTDSPPNGGRQNAPSRRAIADSMIEIWKLELGGMLRSPSKLTAARITLANSRFADEFDHDLERWRGFCRALRDKPFLVGDNDRQWRCDFDWCLKQSNTIQIIEGKYDKQLTTGRLDDSGLNDGPTEPPPEIEGFKFPMGRAH